MSSFINSPEHFNSIEATLMGQSENSNSHLHYFLRDKDISKFVTLIRELQVQCVSLQYKDYYNNK